MIDKILKDCGNNVAYKINNEKITYNELYDRVRKYSILLKKQGSGPIIIYGNKNINYFITMLAAIESKRAYIPVDVFTPYERINKIIDLTKANLIICSSNKLNNINKTIDILLLEDLEKYSNNKSNNIINDIAYIMFTSGSTGNPKGVPISYNNLLNFIKWINDYPTLKNLKDMTILNQASFSFDLSVADIFYSLSNGFTLVSLDNNKEYYYNNIFNTIKDNNINMIVCTPTFMNLCLTNKEFNSSNFSSLKYIYFCGEKLEHNLVIELFERFNDIKIINAYGPTEATSAISAIDITKEMLNEDILPCGYINNLATEISIINREIVLKGESVFSGYLGNIENGFFKDNNINCFKTGDYGYIKDNKLYVKGRKDSQIKLKGYRIELGDIENNIRKLFNIKECVVIPIKNDLNVVKFLKAFIICDNKIDILLLKNKLKELLPDYMIPKIIIQIDKFPINNNGKIDRKKLIEYE